MAKMIDKLPQYEGEKKVWHSFSSNLPQHWVVYNTRSVNGREYDFCVLAPDVGLFIIEVKGWNPDGILTVVDQNTIILAGESEPKGSPRSQARGYRFDLLNKIKKELGINPLVMSLVCYPLISESKYNEIGLNVVSEANETIFMEDLEDPSLLYSKFINRYNVDKGAKHEDFNSKNVSLIRHYFEPNYDVKNDEDVLNPGYSRLRVFVNDISEQVAIDIAEEYGKGIKEIVFVNSQKSMLELEKAVDSLLYSRKVFPLKNNLMIGIQHIDIGSLEDSFSIFNYSVFVVEEIDTITSKDLLIEDGECSCEVIDILKKLSDTTSFNLQQYEIEHAPCDQNILVTAGAGTGKTYSMVSRIAYLCNKKIDSTVDIANDIAMITFTNDAADNMSRRVKQMFVNYFVLTSNEKYMNYIESMNQLQISTIHKFAIALLQRDCLRMGLGYDSQISNETYNRQQLYHYYLNEYLLRKTEETPDFIQQLLLPTYKIEELLIAFSDKLYDKSFDIKELSKSNLGSSPVSMPFFNEMIFAVAVEAEKVYAQQLKDENLIGLRECMIQLHNLVASGKMQNQGHRYKYVFVDEFQDTDDIQIETISALQRLFGKQCHLFVVGDLKQSIYRFRGASLSAFDKVMNASNIGDWSCYSLSRNYRTDKHLLDLYHDLFVVMGDNNLLPYDGKMDRLTSQLIKAETNEEVLSRIESHSKQPEEYYEDLFNAINEQISVISRISQISHLSKEERTIAILVRYNYEITRILREAESNEDLDFKIQVSDGGDLYRLDSTMDLYKLVMAVVNPNNTVYLTNLLKSNYVLVKKDPVQISGCSNSKKKEELIAILDEYFMLHLGKTWNHVVSDFYSRPVLVVLREIYEATKPWVCYKDKTIQELYRENYNLLLEIITRKYSRSYVTINKIFEFLKINITTYQEEASRSIDQDNEGITVLCTTIHKSKGLEYGTVILPYTNEDIASIRRGGLTVNVIDGNVTYSISSGYDFDASGSFDEETESRERMSEETRVLYVAMTRAIRKFIWIKDLDIDHAESWKKYLEGDQ